MKFAKKGSGKDRKTKSAATAVKESKKIKAKKPEKVKTSSGKAAKGTTKMKNRIMRMIFAIVLVDSLVLGALGVIVSIINTRNSANTLLESSVNSYDLLMEAHLNSYKNTVKQMAASTSLSSFASVNALTVTLQNLQMSFNVEEFICIELLKENGHSYDDLVDRSDTEYYQRAAQGETVMLSPTTFLTAEGEEMTAIPIATPVTSTYKGYFVAYLDVTKFCEVVSQARIGEKGESFILDGTSTLVACYVPEVALMRSNLIELAKTDSTYETPARDAEKIISLGEGNFISGTKEYSFRQIEGSDGWIFVSYADMNEMMSSAYILIVLFVVVAAVSIILSSIIARRISNKLSSPIVDVCGSLELLSDGDLSSKNGPKTNIDELQRLSYAMNKTTQNLNLYIGDVKRVLTSISEKDINLDVTQEYIGDFIELKESLLSIIASLNDTMSDINTVSSDVLSASSQVSDTAQNLAQGATEQASTIDGLLTTINSVSEQAKRTAKNAEAADRRAVDAKEGITLSNQEMQRLAEAMDEISDSSAKIASIIKLIEDIAFQTNILALNAAVEAARAGANGKSFAVVADEVKSLANKSAAAAKDTTVLIKSTLAAIDNGKEITQRNVESLENIVGVVENVAELVNSISDESNAQSEAIEQIVSGLDQVSVVVQSNSATAEESAAVSVELAKHANHLQALVNEFTLKD